MKRFFQNKYFIFFIIILFFLLAVLFLKKSERSIRILAWQGSFSYTTIEEFEKETGIKIHLSYFSTNEELLSKMALNKGKGFDIIVPSDYLVEKLYQNGYIKELDVNKLHDLDKVYNYLLRDVTYNGKLFGLPLEFGIYGITFSTDFLIKNNISENPDFLYSFFFSPEESYIHPRLCTTNDSAAACVIALLYGNTKSENTTFSDHILSFFRKQKPFIYLYSDTKAGYAVASKEIDMAFTQSDDFLRTVAYDESLVFCVHPRCSIKTVEYAALSSSTSCTEEAYEFLNFVFRKDIMAKNMEQLRYLPVRNDILDTAPHAKFVIEIFNIINQPEYQLKSIFDVISEEERLKVWIQLKSLD